MGPSSARTSSFSGFGSTALTPPRTSSPAAEARTIGCRKDALVITVDIGCDLVDEDDHRVSGVGSAQLGRAWSWLLGWVATPEPAAFHVARVSVRSRGVDPRG